MGANSILGRMRNFLLLAGVPVAACSNDQMIVSKQLTYADNSKPLQGLFYYLPKAVIPITIVGSDGTDSSAKGGQPGANAMPGGNPSPSSSSGTSKPPSSAPTATATASPQISVTVQTAQGEQSANKTPPAYKLAVTAGKPMIVPDPTEEYFLNYTPNAWSDDTLSLQVDGNGLLQSAKGQAVDQSAAVGTALVQLAAVAAGFPANVNIPAALIVDRNGNPIKPPPVKVVSKCTLPSVNKSFNYEPGYLGDQDDGSEPSILPGLSSYVDRSGVQRKGRTWIVARSNTDAGQSVKVTISEAVAAGNLRAPSAGDPEHPPGILFRNRADWTIDIDVSPSGDVEKYCHIMPMHHEIRDVLIPNGGTKFWEDLSREPLITKQVNLTVQNGMLTGVDPTRPSTVLAWVKLPLTIIQPILSAPFTAVSSGTTQPSGTSGTAPPPSGN